jgi:hypothetical protein
MKNFKEIVYGNLFEAKLKNPDKADLNNDGKLSGYEEKRGTAIEKSMAEKGKLEEEDQPEAADVKTAEKIGRDQYVDETAGTVNFISAEELEKLLADTAMSDKKVVPDLSYEIKSFTEGEQDGTKVLGLKMVNDVVYFKTNEEEDGPDQGVYYKISV